MTTQPRMAYVDISIARISGNKNMLIAILEF